MKYDFFITGLRAFVHHFRSKMKNVNENMNVYIINTGDHDFIKDFIDKDTDMLYESVPRTIIDILGLNLSTDQLTSPFVEGQFTEIDDDGLPVAYSANVKRLPIIFKSNVKIICNDLIESLMISESLLNVFYWTNTFEFEHLSKNHTGMFTITLDSIEAERNVELAHDSTRRLREILLNVDISFQYPSFDYHDSNSLRKSTNVVRTAIHNVHYDGGISTREYTPEKQ